MRPYASGIPQSTCCFAVRDSESIRLVDGASMRVWMWRFHLLICVWKPIQFYTVQVTTHQMTILKLNSTTLLSTSRGNLSFLKLSIKRFMHVHALQDIEVILPLLATKQCSVQVRVGLALTQVFTRQQHLCLSSEVSGGQNGIQHTGCLLLFRGYWEYGIRAATWLCGNRRTLFELPFSRSSATTRYAFSVSSMFFNRVLTSNVSWEEIR